MLIGASDYTNTADEVDTAGASKLRAKGDSAVASDRNALHLNYHSLGHDGMWL